MTKTQSCGLFDLPNEPHWWGNIYHTTCWNTLLIQSYLTGPLHARFITLLKHHMKASLGPRPLYNSCWMFASTHPLSVKVISIRAVTLKGWPSRRTHRWMFVLECLLCLLCLIGDGRCRTDNGSTGCICRMTDCLLSYAGQHCSSSFKISLDVSQSRLISVSVTRGEANRSWGGDSESLM